MKHQVEYYKKRANEYELIYQKPERQDDLLKIEKYLGNQFQNKKIIEIACGTGFWTQKLARTCESILAIDINKTVIEIAQQKNYSKHNVKFEVQDLTQLRNRRQKLEGLFGGFIWSHIKKEEIQNFLTICLHQISHSSELIFIDNKYVAGSSTPISRMDEKGNKYQKRTLRSGEEFEVVKNFPSRKEFAEMIGYGMREFEWLELDYYWIAKFKKR